MHEFYSNIKTKLSLNKIKYYLKTNINKNKSF